MDYERFTARVLEKSRLQVAQGKSDLNFCTLWSLTVIQGTAVQSALVFTGTTSKHPENGPSPATQKEQAGKREEHQKLQAAEETRKQARKGGEAHNELAHGEFDSKALQQQSM